MPRRANWDGLCSGFGRRFPTSTAWRIPMREKRDFALRFSKKPWSFINTTAEQTAPSADSRRPSKANGVAKPARQFERFGPKAKLPMRHIGMSYRPSVLRANGSRRTRKASPIPNCCLYGMPGGQARQRQAMNWRHIWSRTRRDWIARFRKSAKPRGPSFGNEKTSGVPLQKRSPSGCPQRER